MACPVLVARMWIYCGEMWKIVQQMWENVKKCGKLKSECREMWKNVEEGGTCYGQGNDSYIDLLVLS